MLIDQVMHNGQMLAIVVKHNYSKRGISFFTPGDLSQQVAYMQHPKGHMIDAHVHNKVVREVHYTQEVLVLRKGKLRVDFYDAERNYLESRIIEAGDLILLASGGHGFKVLEDVEMFEIKQGPYAGDNDKTRFNSVTEQDIVIPEDDT